MVQCLTEILAYRTCHLGARSLALQTAEVLMLVYNIIPTRPVSKVGHPGVCLLVLLGPSVANPNLQSLTQKIGILNKYSFGLR